MSCPTLVRMAVLMFVLCSSARAHEGHSSGEAMCAAGKNFVGTLTDAQRSTAVLKFDDNSRFDWHYIPKDRRKGMQIKEMTAAQRKSALTLLRSCLSEIGYNKATKIMSLEEILNELEKKRGGGPIRDPERYYFTLFGQVDQKGTWGLSVEGHHLSLNFTVRDGKVVGITPAFFGSNPAEVTVELPVGQPQGTRVLEREETLGFELLHSLTDEQRKLAIINDKAPDDVKGAGQAQSKFSEPEGLPAAKMNPDQLVGLWELISTYARNMPDDQAEPRLKEIKEAGIEKIHFAWAGAQKPGIGHYYRVQGPSFVLELVNVQPDSAGNPANHIHSLWRSLKGDFGLPRE